MMGRHVLSTGGGFPILALAGLLVACGDAPLVAPETESEEPLVTHAFATSRRSATRFAGDVTVVWPGGKGSGAPDGADRVAQGVLAAFVGVPAGSPGPGNFTYRVVNVDGTVHREIGVTLFWVGLEDQVTNPGEVRFLGVVTSDTKPCGGSGHGEEGCGDDEGGCSHDDEGGCTDEEGGCSHDDEGTTHDDGGGCPGGGDHESGGQGNPVNGSDCRIGQVVVGWALDGGTPALAGDRISWKWMAPDAPKVLAIQAAIDAGQPIPWPCKLCEKEILGGNLRLIPARN